jgi:hypothetical protein
MIITGTTATIMYGCPYCGYVSSYRTACNCGTITLPALPTSKVVALDLEDETWLSAWIHDGSDARAAMRRHAQAPARVTRGPRPLPRQRSSLPRPMRATPAIAA